MSQCLDSLALANERRLSLADIKRQVRALPFPEGMPFVADLLDQPDGHAVDYVRIGQLMNSIRRWGPTKTERCLHSIAEVRSVDRRVGEMTRRQRTALAEYLRYYRCS